MKKPSLDRYKDTVEQALKEQISSFQEKSFLKEACWYALSSKGKRLRPLIVLSVAEAIGKKWNVLPAALSVEFFHTASLIADDLPCMDNEDMRRNRPSVHCAFGESTALLASYSLISLGYEMLSQNAQLIKDNSFGKRLTLALEQGSRAGGISGATGGQFFDLHLSKPTYKKICQIIARKTITLFEISFIFGWIFGGGNLFHLSKMKKVAFHLGMAFQVADDLQDLEEDLKRNNRKNMAAFLGKRKAKELVHKEIQAFISSLKELHLFSQNFQEMIHLLF